MAFFENCPTEIVEMIFSHLKKAGILKLTLISPKANKIISNSRQLMQNCRFNSESWRRTATATRKYSQIDYVELDRPSSSVLTPVLLTQLTFHQCHTEVHVLHVFFSKISSTLEVLIFDDCSLFNDPYDNKYGRDCLADVDSDYYDDEEWVHSRIVDLPKLKTLILADLSDKSQIIVLSMIKASTLTELGLITAFKRHNETISKLFIDLIKCNPKIKALHVPRAVSEDFLANALEHPEFEYNLKELSLAFIPERNTFSDTMNFLESQRDTLRCCRLEGCAITEEHTERLLSLKLVRLELHLCSMEMSQATVFENTSIESLAFIWVDDSRDKAICRFIESCKNLSAFVAYIKPLPPHLFARMKKSCKILNIHTKFLKSISWTDLRSLRFMGVAFTIEYVNDHRKYCFYNGKLKEVSADNHPYWTLAFSKKSRERKHIKPKFTSQK